MKLAVVVVLGLAVGVAGYVAIQAANRPAPREAPGWELRAELPNPRGETAGAVADGRLYVIGGLAGLAAEASAEVSIYDPATDGWTAGPPLPEPRHHAGAVGLDGIVYVTGGAASATDWTPRSDAWALAPGDTEWTAMPPLPEPRLGHRMVALDGQIYVVGGVGGSDDGAAVLVYEPVAGRWATASPLPRTRDHLAVVVSGLKGDEIWVIGGRGAGRNHDRVDIYEPALGRWRIGPPLPFATSGASEASFGSVIVVSGGEDPGGAVIDRHWILEPGPDGSAWAWQPLPPPPLVVHGAPGFSLDGRFYVVGGSLRPGAQSSLAWTGATQVFELAWLAR